ncbi:GNAT family N-acetyltransferase [Bizionia arctica]|uniref:N-acetyltransferase n=1 Tax=Bizionia arctica TaxID=1495645 RepID=A0A917GJ63_9FLAO|nr:GNAT family N-acetyltransferase [Bizionia arctica]GGG47740.1 N-acetyltransferase [Bizionia arctica]
MIIRKATKADSKIISEHMVLAMQDIIYEFIGTKDLKKAKTFLLYFVERENNQYSYTNCFVLEIDNELVGTINIYNGATLKTLRESIALYIKNHFEIDFNPENETQQGEYYIDTIGISPEHQGKGIGTHLLKYIIETYCIKRQQTIGLLVDEDNPNAEKLYLNLGFEFVGKKVLAGKQMKHLQRKPLKDIT